MDPAPYTGCGRSGVPGAFQKKNKVKNKLRHKAAAEPSRNENQKSLAGEASSTLPVPRRSLLAGVWVPAAARPRGLHSRAAAAPLWGKGAAPPAPAGRPRNQPPGAPLHSPLAFSSDMLALGGVIRSLGSEDHIRTADTQTYLPVPADSRDVLSWLITCRSALQAWVTFNFLKLNAGKTESLQIG